MSRAACRTAGKTFEARRSEAADARGRPMGPRHLTQAFLGLVEDRHRPRVGLWPFPKAVPPPPPPTEQRKQVPPLLPLQPPLTHVAQHFRDVAVMFFRLSEIPWYTPSRIYRGYLSVFKQFPPEIITVILWTFTMSPLNKPARLTSCEGQGDSSCVRVRRRRSCPTTG